MRIGLDAGRLTGQRLGVGRYLEYMLQHWHDDLTCTEELVVFLKEEVDPADPVSRSLTGRIRPVVLPSRLSVIPWQNVHLWRAARTVDVLFCPAYAAPVPYRGRLVVAIHSMDEVFPGAQSWWHAQTYSRLYRYSARRAAAVIVPSEVTRRDLVRAYGIDDSRVEVVHQGADDAFRPIADEGLLSATRRKFFGDDRPYVLFVGKCSRRRNIPMLLEAFALLKRERRIPHGLLIFGPNHLDLPMEALCRDLGIGDSVVQTDGRVTEHRELVPIYNAADVFVHPSSYEGWSMTTVEALACGTAVVAVDQGGLAEVVGRHGLLVSDPRAETLAEAIGRVLRDDALRRDLQASARRRSEDLRWRALTRQTLDVLRRVAGETRPVSGGTWER